MSHIGSSILQIYQECSGFYTPLVYVSLMSHVWLRQTSRIVLCSWVNFLNKDINVCCVSTPVFLPRVKLPSECSMSQHKHMVYSHRNGAMLSAGDMV